MRNFSLSVFFLVALVLMVEACFVSINIPLDSKKPAPLIPPLETYIYLEKAGKDSIIVHSFVNAQTILFARSIKDTTLAANLVLTIRIVPLESKDEKIITRDTIHIVRLQDMKQLIHIATPIFTGSITHFTLTVEITDIHRGTTHTSKMYYSWDEGSQPVRLFLRDGKTPFFGTAIFQKSELMAKCECDTIYVIFHAPDTTFPPPPMATSTSQNTTDTVKGDTTIYVVRENDTVIISFAREGIYVIKSDKSSESRIVLVTDSLFPFPSNYYDLIRGLRYIMKKNEYEECIASTTPRKCFENFFLQISDNDRDMARNLISKYYGRLVYANYAFTSHKPGFLTDRGLIFMIFGNPVVKNVMDTLEIWYYGPENSPLALSFEFVRKKTKYDTYDFYLTRDEGYRLIWYRQIDMIRNGEIKDYTPLIY